MIYSDSKEPDRILRQCPHCGHETDEYKFILIDGTLECPHCFTPIIERKEGEDGNQTNFISNPP